MKFNKKFLSFLLLALFAFALIGCDGDATTVEPTEVPTTVAPTTEQPTTVAPTTEEPTTVAPTTEEPTTVEPTTEEPTTVEPTTEEPTTEEPTTEEPIDLEALIDQVVATYADTLEDETFVATEDLNLIATIGGLDITWESNNTTYLGNDGTVTRPLLSVGDQTVLLTASITDGTNVEEWTFFVTIGALTEKTGQEIANEVFLVAMAFPNKTLWTSADELTFAETGLDGDDNSYDITWTSSHLEIIALDGTITQPEGADVDVTITATITVNSVEFSRERVFTVSKLLEGEEVSTIAEGFALGEDTYIKILGVTVIAKDSDGNIFFTDGTDVMYIYGVSFTAEIGSVYDISGVVAYYYNAPQLVGNDTQPLKAAPSTAAVSDAPVVAGQTVMDVINNSSLPTIENPHEFTRYEVTGAVYFNEAWGNYSVFLVPSDYDFDAPLDSGATQPNANSIMMYYKSDMDVLKAFHGQEITIEIIMVGYRTDKSVYYANFFGTVDDVVLSFANDADAVEAALNVVEFPYSVVENQTFDLTKSIYGVTIAYTTDNDTVFDTTTGLLDTSSLTEQTTINITATATKGTESDTKTISIKVGPLPTSNISDVLALPNDDLAKIEGTVVAGGYYRLFFIQDATGNIAIYVRDSALITLLENNVGNVVSISGSKGISNGLHQLSPSEITFVEVGTPVTATNIDTMTLDETGLLAHQGKLVELTGMVVTDVYVDNFGNYQFTLERISDGEVIQLRWDSRYALPTALDTEMKAIQVGDKVTVTTVLSWYRGPQLALVTTTEFIVTDLTDQEALDLDMKDFPETLMLTEDMVIPTGTYGTVYEVIDIFGNASNYIDATTSVGNLLVTQPYGFDATAVMTVRLTSGTVVVEETIEVTVKAISISSITTDLFFSEYGEGSGNNKWLEIYNGTGAEVDLSIYTIEYYSNGSTSNPLVYVFTGTLANGEVYVLTTDQATAEIQALADSINAYASVVHFNGDDAVVLKRDGVIIDTILNIGHPKDDKIAAEVTWVRNSNILQGNTVFTIAEWTAYGQDYIGDLGVHVVDTVEMTNEIKVEVDKAELNLGGYSYGEEIIVLPSMGANGSAITWAITLDAGSNAVLVDGELTLSAVSADAVVTITATLTLGDTDPVTQTATFTYMLVGTSDVDRVAEDKADLEALELDVELYLAADIELPTMGTFGSDITWAITADLANMATLNTEGNMVSIANAIDAEAVVELTATISYGAESQTVVVTFTLKAYPVVDLGDFTNQTEDTIVVVQGFVYEVFQDGFFIEDATGKIFVYSPSATYVIGDEVFLTGVVDINRGSYQLSGLLEMPAALSVGNDVEQTPIMYEDGVTVLVPGETYTVLGTVALEGTYSNVYIYFNATESFYVYYKSPSASIDALEAMVGKEILVDIIYFNDTDTFIFTGDAADVQEVITVTDFSDLYAMTDGTNFDIPVGALVKLTGVVTGDSFDGLFVQDANGVGFFMYKPFETGINIGDEVTYLGTVGEYKDARQLGYGAELLEVVSTGNVLIVTSVTADEIDAFTTADAGALYSFDGFTFEGTDGTTMMLGYTLIDGVTEGIVNVRYYSNWDDLVTIAGNYTVGDALPAVQFIVYNYRDALVQGDVLSVDFTNADFIQFDAADVPATLELTEDYLIPTAEYGSTYTITGITGDAAAFLDYTTTPGTILVTQPTDADKVGVITVEVDLGTETTIVVTIDVTVKMFVEAGPVVTYVENFDTSNATSSYADGSFVGVEGITWTYTASRDGNNDTNGSGIDLPALMLRYGTSTISSSTISGGISFFEVKLYKGFTGGGDRQVEVFINGVSIGTSVIFDDFDEHILRIENINIEGDFTIEIKNITTKQIIIDDITWGTYTVE